MTDTQTMTEPTDKELEDFAVEEQFLLFCDVDEFTQIARAVLAKWGTPPAVAERLEVTEAECEAAVLELEIEDLHTTPQPTQAQAGAVPMSHKDAKALVLKYGIDPLHLVLQVERHHGITGGQHGTE